MAAKPVVRKLRRFSVSPSSSTFDVSKTPQTSSADNRELPRPKTLTIGIPGSGELRDGPPSAPIMRPSLPDSVDLWSTRVEKKHDGENSAEESCTSTNQSNSAHYDHRRAQNFAAESGKSPDGSSCSNVGSAGSNTSENSYRNSQTISVPAEEVMRDVRIVIGDLINYVVYEETSRIERKRSLLLQTTSFPAGELISTQGGLTEELKELTPTKICTTPSRMVNIAEEVTEESEQMIVSGVVRGMVREVLRREKEELRSTLDRRRKRSVVPSNTPV
ncbi:hypothetical protein TELCIR_13406 [Teladorsagia circumcincta]|uniref:Uncharacterized protein n=1 Tax=Teladorsagia circumcincta TaxID=45464 RepID=A0A2G9U3X4_TELCI|nr:hypothetical protein TELCIR_13406 [Teladorsagia circumcincta]